eukprot:TRINITY_DN2098_c5_g1_i1.p1 TRINITY_DN2098_c5_g1~~TRINITY_DN2098_c5_g1_i1.p1  ORF type:complete len:444 (+),score=83.04 TRINITY_DN2098_c5_g1_i1:126-1334(+)
MTFDVAAARHLATEAVRVFSDGLQELVRAAAAEAAKDRERLEHEALVLSRERKRLEEAWSQLHVERARFESTMGVSTGYRPSQHMAEYDGRAEERFGSIGPPRHSQLLTSSIARLAETGSEQVPADYMVAVGDCAYAVLPLKEPSAPNLGHDLWNHVVEVPDGWEVLCSSTSGFHHVMAELSRHSWGAMVMGVRNENNGFDAYWTTSFGDGSHAGQLCEGDVDWIEEVEQGGRRFRMTYSGLRLVICARPTTLSPDGAGGGRGASVASVAPSTQPQAQVAAMASVVPTAQQQSSTASGISVGASAASSAAVSAGLHPQVQPALQASFPPLGGAAGVRTTAVPSLAALQAAQSVGNSPGAVQQQMLIPRGAAVPSQQLQQQMGTQQMLGGLPRPSVPGRRPGQ